jgi:anaerobic selenocysteine-containing dehydrogenase
MKTKKPNAPRAKKSGRLEQRLFHPDLTRRHFLQISAAAGGTAALLGGSAKAAQAIEEVLGPKKGSFFEAQPENQIYSVCLQCNTGCGIKVKIQNGIAAKIDGNPYSPWTLYPHVAYATPVKDMARTEGAICPKGQSGLQTAYDPYRIMSVLKRKPGTKRGAGEWVTISFDKAIDEVVNGGDLFGEGPVDGFKAVYALKDAKVAKAMGEEVARILDEKDKEKKKALVEQFKVTFKDHLGTLIDPEHPDLGPKNNQFVFVWGRMKNGREDLAKRFVKDGFGSQNANGHTTICQGSLYFTGKAMSEQFDPAKGKFGGGDKFYWQSDTGNSDFVIFVGANVFEANYGPPHRTPKIMERVTRGEMKYAVLDPRCSKVASKAWKWVPVQPGTDAAFAAGMIRWIVENQKLNVAGEKEDGSDAVPDADAEELRIFAEARKHLPKSVLDIEKWRAAVGDQLWRKVVYVMNRGGRYQDFAKAHPGELVANKYGKMLGLYQEKTATATNTMTGKKYVGHATYIPAGLSSMGEPIVDSGYDLHLITYKEISMAKARGISNYWVTALLSEGFILMNKADADRLGLRNGDQVKVTSASNPDGVLNVKDGKPVGLVGKLKVVQGIRPGVVAFPLGYGHWASGARDITIDGQLE